MLVSVLLYKGPLVIRNSEPVVANQGSGYGHRGARLYTTVNVYAMLCDAGCVTLHSRTPPRAVPLQGPARQGHTHQHRMR
jgi:hypothetical protein